MKSHNRYAGLITNDFTNGEGVCVSFWTQFCPHRCKGCHNPETWALEGGKELPTNIQEQIIKAITANGVHRNFSILGGEPLCKENLNIVNNIVMAVRKTFPDIKIFVWTGYTIEQLKEQNNQLINNILFNITVLIDGQYKEEKRDITLKFRGSKNQRILYQGVDF